MDKQLLEQELKAEAIAHVKRVGGNNACYDSYIAGATSSSTVKEKNERIKALEDGIKWALNNPQSVFLLDELQKLLK